MRSPLKKAKGYGSAGNGTEHWWLQRLTAIALIFLVSWFTFVLISFGMNPEVSLTSYLYSKLGVVLFSTLLIVALFHANLGFKVVVEDYIHCEFTKFTILIVSNLLVSLTIIFLIFTFIDIFITNI